VRNPPPDYATASRDNPERANLSEAWGLRAIRSRRELLDRGQKELLWLETEYQPVVAMLREAGLV
jgi:hypothetical protein